jgi:hypothetical protein
MVVFLRKNLVLAMMAVVLLAGPVGWMAQSATMRTAPAYHSIFQLKCPPPPYDC